MSSVSSFIEEEFIKGAPKSVKTIGVLGQVHDGLAVHDKGVHSCLYSDVLAAVTFSDHWHSSPSVADIKYPRDQSWTPKSIEVAFRHLGRKPGQMTTIPDEPTSLQILDPAAVQQYTFWDVDESSSASASIMLGQALSKDSAGSVSVRTGHDNLVRGGIVRTDIRKSKTIEASYPIEAADVAYVGMKAF
jgi:sulfite reductase (NADPH) flavoprotein alpha-component